MGVILGSWEIDVGSMDGSTVGYVEILGSNVGSTLGKLVVVGASDKEGSKVGWVGI